MNQTEDEKRSLVTFAVLAYNQEEFIREAVKGAFAQTYSPLEIIISDDCSKDLTFNIINEMASKYEGPHNIIINRNEINMGIISHLNLLMSRARGKLIVLAAGDDISLPNRVSILHKNWERFGHPNLIISNFIEIDIYDKEISEPIFKKSRDIKFPYLEKATIENLVKFIDGESKVQGVGATQALSAMYYKLFGPLGHNANNEDTINFFRSFLCGGRLYVPNRLVRYRVHRNSVSQKGIIKKDLISRYQFLLPAYYNNIVDLDTALSSELISTSDYSKAKIILENRIKVAEIISNWENVNFIERFILYVVYIRKIGNTFQKNWAQKRLFGVNSIKLYLKLKTWFFQTECLNVLKNRKKEINGSSN